MTRSTIAAASLPNTVGYLSGWIAEPQHVKPGNYMPDLDLSGPQLTRIRTFLETLR
jgi:cytochrome c oxidase subunit 2